MAGQPPSGHKSNDEVREVSYMMDIKYVPSDSQSDGLVESMESVSILSMTEFQQLHCCVASCSK